jgi:hypothetical protein
LKEFLLILTSSKEGNSGIADLSDPNRPQKLCEQFNNLYDNLWTDAFDHLSRTENSERIVCEDLVTIFKVRLTLSSKCWSRFFVKKT